MPKQSLSESGKPISLALFAPYNEHVELLAEWNDWKPAPMQRGDDGWWRADVKPADGVYGYRFGVKSRSFFAAGKTLDVADPYALQITESDPENAVLRVAGGRRETVAYKWQHDDVPLTTNDRLIIYEMHIGDFTGSPEKPGTFTQAIRRLDYIRDMGINAIELMPVQEFPGRSWGYNLKSLFAVENTYGTPEELCQFIDECHARGIRVIMDGVFNHMNADAFLTKIDYEYWFYKENPDGPAMDWGPKFNHGFFDEKLKVFPAKKYVLDAIQFWVETFHIDGIRFDATAALKSFDLLKELTTAAYGKVGERKPFICISEHIPEDPAITGRERGAPMDASWHDWLGVILQAAMADVEKNGNQPHDVARILEQMDPNKNGYEKAARMVTYVGNHDFHRPMFILGNEGKIFGEEAFRRMKLGQGLILTAPGIPLIWMGSEFGMPSEKTLDPRPLQWNLLDGRDNKSLLEFHQKLIRIRHDTPALRGDFFQTILCDHDRQIIGFKRWTNEGSIAIVVANLRDQPSGPVEIKVEGLAETDWVDALTGQKFHAAGDQVTGELGPSDFKIFIKK